MGDSTTRTGGELLVACLEAQGVTSTFGVPGESFLAVLDGLHDSPIDFVICRQEGGVGYSAAAWGKLTSSPGIGFVTRGPGATNASIGVHAAMQDSTPMILFIGQAAMSDLGREAFQEVDYRAFFGPLAKWATQIESADRIPEIISRAFSTALSGRPGPVVIALPEDVLSARTDAIPGRKVRVAQPSVGSGVVDEAVGWLDRAERPLIVAGDSPWRPEASRQLESFAETNDIPIIVTFRSLDIIDNRSPSFVGEAGFGLQPHVRELISNADVVLALGPRFDETLTEAYTLFDMPDSRQTIIHVHPAATELGKVVQADLPVHASVDSFVDALTGSMLTPSAARHEWITGARDARAAALVAPPQPGALDMGEVMRWLQDELPTDVIVTNGAGNFTIWPNKHFVYGPEARLLGPQAGSMGYGLPAAIAAKVANPDRMVVCFAGDGDIQMNMQELGTAMQAGVQPIVLVLNNGMYGTIRMHQERDFPTRVSGTEILNPDYVQLAGAYGFHAERVERTDEFAGAWTRAVESRTGALLELIVPPQMLTPSISVDQLRST